MKSSISNCLFIIGCILTALSVTLTAAPDQAGWKSRPVDWRLSGGSRIKAIHYPPSQPPATLDRQSSSPVTIREKTILPDAASRLTYLDQTTVDSVTALVIDSPPIDGFVPWIAVLATNKRLAELEIDAVPYSSITGSLLTADPQNDYALGIFDTGASAHVMGHDQAVSVGISGSYLTTNTVEITGATGSVDAWVSKPLGIFIDGLSACEPNGVLTDTSGMVGEYNVAIAVGQSGSNLPTAIGSPLSVYYAADFNIDQPVVVVKDGAYYIAPDITFYELSDPCIPSYPNSIPLELRPLGGTTISYVYDPFDYPEYNPTSPSVIVGNSLQSLFFVHSVDLTDGNYSAIDKDRFMLDTGAQITVVGSRVAARLAFDPAQPEFEVEIQDVTGESTTAPGFYIDSLDIPALGNWLSFTNIPVVLLDVASPEGGTLDGIIGMNLFVDLNFAFHGGGLFGLDDPYIEFEPIPFSLPDIAPARGDGKIDILDLIALSESWLADPFSPRWNLERDIAPSWPDGIINIRDFAVLSQYWLTPSTP